MASRHRLIPPTGTSITVLKQTRFPDTFSTSIKPRRYSRLWTPIPKLMKILLAPTEKLSTVSVWTLKPPTNANSVMNLSLSHALTALSPRWPFSIERHSISLKGSICPLLSATQIDIISPQTTTTNGKVR